jgi:DNA-binding NarL/FixJ family response regulator
MGEARTWPALSTETLNILRVSAEGGTVEAASIRMRIPLGTAKYRVRAALTLWEVSTRAALVHLACVRGLLPADLPCPEPERRLLRAERRVVRHLAAGGTYAAIGSRVYLAPNTIKTYVRRALRARRARTSPQLVYLAHRDGWLGADLCTCREDWPPTSCPVHGDALHARPPLLVDVHLPEPAGETDAWADSRLGGKRRGA